MQIETIQELVEANRIIWTQHAKDRIKQRKILKDDVERGILCGEIIEDYLDSYPFKI